MGENAHFICSTNKLLTLQIDEIIYQIKFIIVIAMANRN